VMQANYVQRLRLTFTKEGPARFISHLDLARALERTMLRATIPVAYSQGYNRRPRLQLAHALALGFLSECELADIWLTDWREPEAIRVSLEAKMPPGIKILRVSEVDVAGPSLPSITCEAAYSVRFINPVDSDWLRQQTEELMRAESCFIQRARGKRDSEPYDIRPLIHDLHLVSDSEKPALEMRLSLRPDSQGRADDVVGALGLDPLDVVILRKAISLVE